MITPTDQALVDAFYEAAVLLQYKVEHEGWKWSSNYLREYVRCRYNYRFTNSYSPTIMDAVIKQHPEMGAWIKLHKHKREDWI